MPYIPFTDEEKQLANSVDLEQFLRMRGEKLERVGREHKLIYYDSSGKHDSITLRGSTWFDHKNQVGSGAIKFMQEFYDITVAGVKRSLPVVPINENMSIAGFVIFGDTDVVEPCARALAEKLPPETEVLVTAEAKSIPLIYEMAKVMKMPRYVIARKSVKGYMRNPIITTVNSITNMGKEQILVVDEHDAEFIKGKKVAMTWAYSPSYGKPLSVPQGVIGLFTRFGMDVTLAHPEGYDVFPEIEEIARQNCEKYGSKFHKTNSMEEAFKDADIVYPKSWAPFKAMEKRSELYVKGDQKGIDELEKELLAQNAEHKDWTCSEEMMKLTKDGKALYLHCLPADISGLSCPEGEVDNSVFDRYLVPLYKQASYKPYIIAAMIFLAQVKDPVNALMDLDAADNKRKMF